MIVIPMVGLSSRFFNSGYTKPKFQLDLFGETVFDFVIRSFSRYFDTDRFVFACRSDFDSEGFLLEAMKRHKIANYKIKVIEHDTRGQAETVYLSVKDEPEDELYIFNIDTIRPNFIKGSCSVNCDGYLEVFRGDGNNWSFVLPGDDFAVLKTTEKERVSDLCSDGLYYFSSKLMFERSFINALDLGLTSKGEYYVAPLYNHLIENGLSVKYELIDKNDVIFCGTPDEYLLLLSRESIGFS